MNAKKSSLVVDTGVLIEYMEGTDLGKKFKERVLMNDGFHSFFISPLTQVEILYITCRKEGFDRAKEIASEFLKNFLKSNEEDLREDAARLKCKFPIALADCYALALACRKDIPLLMKKESEIEKIINQEDLQNRIIFIEEI